MKRSSSPFTQLSLFLCGALVISSFTLAPVAAIDPVCIVGAGPTGLTIAHELESKNYTTVIFEKQSVVGGKCQAYYDGPNGNTYHPLGALLFTNETYHNTLPIVLDSGEPLTPGIAPPDWHRYVYGPGAEASHVVPQPTPNDTETAAIAAEIQKYTIYWTTEFAPKYSAMRYVNGIPDAYSDPIATFLQREGYVYLPSIMQMGMVPYGYGDVTETPTIYMLQYFTPEVLGVFVAATKSYIVDFHRVFVHYAGTLKASAIQLNTTIKSIDRTNASAPVITYTASSSSEQTQICSHIVLAFPPLLHALQALNMPLTNTETSLFSKLSSTPYWSSAVSVNTAYHNSYLQSPFVPLGEPVAFLRLFNESDVATAWQWGNISSTDQAKTLLASTFTKVQTGAGVNPSTVTADDVKDVRTWDYFAHFTGEDLTAGNAYESFNKLQGVDGTYYASGLNGFETVEFAVRAGKDIVNSFF